MTEPRSAEWKAAYSPGTAQLLLSEWILTFYGILGFWFCFSESGSHRSKTKLELSMWPKTALNVLPSCIQPLSAEYCMVFLGEFFFPVIWEKAKFTESITTIRGIMPNGGFQVINVHSGSLQKLCSEQGRRQ